MKSYIYSLVTGVLLLAQILWISATPVLAAVPRQAINDRLVPIIVDSCPGFSAFDAAAILQEEVQSNSAISNLLFGPLADDILAQGSEGDKKGFCGYGSTASTTDPVDKRQTHLLTAIAADHAVVAQHLTLKSDTDTLSPAWFDLDTLVEVVGAANPTYDRKASQAMLLFAADEPPYPQVLYMVSTGAASFKADWLVVAADQFYDEVLWLWQTLDDGYFSLLIARTGLDYSLVAARLGPDVKEAHVQAYSRLILDKIAPEDAADQDATTDETAGEATEPEQTSLDCALLSADAAATLVGETALAYPVAEAASYGCKYLPASTTDESTADDGSPLFLGSGVLAMVASNDFAAESFHGWPQWVESAGASADEVDAIQAALDADDVGAALQALAQVDLQTEELHITALPEVSDTAVWLRITDHRDRIAIFMRTLPDGRVLQIMVIRSGLAEVEASELEKIEAAIGEAGGQALTDFAQTAAEPSSEGVADQAATTDETVDETPESEPTGLDCSLLSDDDATVMLGVAARHYPIQSTTYANLASCTYLPTVGRGIYSPRIEVLVIPNAGALQLLQGIAELPPVEASERDALQAAMADGDLNELLKRIGQLDLQTPVMAVEALPDVSDDAVLVRMMGLMGNNYAFMRSLPNGGLLQIAFSDSADFGAEASEVEKKGDARRQAAGRALTAFAPNASKLLLALGKLPFAKLGLRTIPLPSYKKTIGESTVDQASYLLFGDLDEEVRSLRELMGWQGWQEMAEFSQVDEGRATLTFEQAGYKVGLTFGATTAVQLRNFGNLDPTTLPVTEDASVDFQVAGQYAYSTDLGIDEAGAFLHNAFTAAGWQDATSAEERNDNTDYDQRYTFVQPGQKLSVQLVAEGATRVTYYSELASTSTDTDTGKQTAEKSSQPVDLLDLRTYPTLAAAEPISGNTIADSTYLMSQPKAEVLDFYRNLMQEQGWQTVDERIQGGDYSDFIIYKQDGYTVQLDVAQYTRIDLVNYGDLDLATLPVTADATLGEQGPGHQTYTTALSMDEAAEFLRQALNEAGWQESTTAEQTRSNSADLQSYTFLRQGHQLALVLNQGETTTVTYQARLVSLD